MVLLTAWQKYLNTFLASHGCSEQNQSLKCHSAILWCDWKTERYCWTQNINSMFCYEEETRCEELYHTLYLKMFWFSCIMKPRNASFSSIIYQEGHIQCFFLAYCTDTLHSSVQMNSKSIKGSSLLCLMIRINVVEKLLNLNWSPLCCAFRRKTESLYLHQWFNQSFSMTVWVWQP